MVGETNLATAVCQAIDLYALPTHEAFEVGGVQFEIPVYAIEKPAHCHMVIPIVDVLDIQQFGRRHGPQESSANLYPQHPRCC